MNLLNPWEIKQDITLSNGKVISLTFEELLGVITKNNFSSSSTSAGKLYRSIRDNDREIELHILAFPTETKIVTTIKDEKSSDMSEYHLKEFMESTVKVIDTPEMFTKYIQSNEKV